MMALVYWTSDGGGSGVGDIPSVLIRWIRANGNPALIVNGGDIYDRGKPTEFDDFLNQMDGDVSMICETAGNHDWKTRERTETAGEIPIGYELFWARFPPPLSGNQSTRRARAERGTSTTLISTAGALSFSTPARSSSDHGPLVIGAASTGCAPR